MNVTSFLKKIKISVSLVRPKSYEGHYVYI